MKCNLAERSHRRLYALFCREIVKIIIVIITCIRRRCVAAKNNREQMQSGTPTRLFLSTDAESRTTEQGSWVSEQLQKAWSSRWSPLNSGVLDHGTHDI